MRTIEEAANEFAIKYAPVLWEEQCISYFKAGVEFAQRWIPVEEELPEDSDISESVNTKTEGGYIFIHRRLFVGGKYVWSNGNDTSIAFWRPIDIK